MPPTALVKENKLVYYNYMSDFTILIPARQIKTLGVCIW